MSFREITSHKVNGVNDGITVEAETDLGPGGAPHMYRCRFANSRGAYTFNFQKGGIQEVGVNGLTHEVLLAIVIDRLEHFQKGPFPCGENAEALKHINRAMACLKQRTENRLARGVEGTHQK